jgi:hypothetical protein
MRHDWDFAGVYVAPFVGHLVAALLILLVLRPLIAKLRLLDYVANPPIVEAGLFICILAVLTVALP